MKSASASLWLPRSMKDACLKGCFALPGPLSTAADGLLRSIGIGKGTVGECWIWGAVDSCDLSVARVEHSDFRSRVLRLLLDPKGSVRTSWIGAGAQAPGLAHRKPGEQAAALALPWATWDLALPSPRGRLCRAMATSSFDGTRAHRTRWGQKGSQGLPGLASQPRLFLVQT
eukprot:CAMPEP_0181525626 /NCGR_PEP_ID=MMETSP1110-20121109/69063_1 /TAXON_ID=174948 /ORGANISM="Symbiodinium sp., Strain CCMP421" /LENGTH=171 /DNA_ID=CAMNT_0023656433 /DNA_START=474 /DNA_END=985 /DNA_ORIENTATION=-